MDKLNNKAIGVFDSGYGGLSVLKEIIKLMPDYDFNYLGDNARTPYGNRSFEAVYTYTLQSVKKLFELGSELVILACNTASAKALRTIQQEYLPTLNQPWKRVLGVIRPSVEIIGKYTNSSHVGVLGTRGTVASNSYPLEIHKIYPEITVQQEACPMWVALVENNEFNNDGADYFIENNIINILSLDNQIDTLILGCTHYPLLIEKIKKYTPKHISILSQGEIVANSLKDYLNRHPEMDAMCSKNSIHKFYTTDSPKLFKEFGSIFCDKINNVKQIEL
ncbi:MAG: glutamate racemase [Bacteroidales bacterium]|nr:glutamate racemase [Bacteroidales bacterium]MBN2758374.1 glutamate racemase [Bacteroidales bacterium]